MKIGVTQLIAAPAADIFQLSQDYSKRLSWDPFLRQAILLHSDTAGLGVRSWCVAWFGMGMESEYVSFHPPKTVAVKMTKGPWILENFAASWNFHPVRANQSANQTEVGFVYSFRMRPSLRPLTPIVAVFFRYEMKRRLQALKKACESAG